MTADGIVDFLLVRIAEDAAERLHRDDCGLVGNPEGWCDCSGPARVLAECEAKRRIVEDLAEAGRDGSGRYEEGYGLMTAIQHLAAVYADHPDYRDEWRP